MRFLVASVILGLGSLAAHAGNENGGGGGAVVCRNPDHSIMSVETLDIYEAKNMYGLYVPEQAGSVKEIVANIKVKLRDSLAQPEIHLYPLIERVQSIMRFTQNGAKLEPVDDAAAIVLPKDCKIEQLANYVDDNLLVVQHELWERLSNTQKAALILHEAIYRLERYEGATTSRRTRRIVASLFSNLQLESVESGLPLNRKRCSATKDNKLSYSFYYYPTSNNMTKLQFTHFEGSTVYSLKTAVIPFALPWWDSYIETAPCGSEKRCNFSGGDTRSVFEGNGFIVVGRELAWDNSVRFYFKDSKGELNYLSCNM